MGVKLGAIRCRFVSTGVGSHGHESVRCRHTWTTVDSCGHSLDACGIESSSFRAVWTGVDGCRQRLEIYGSGVSAPAGDHISGVASVPEWAPGDNAIGWQIVERYRAVRSSTGLLDNEDDI